MLRIHSRSSDALRAVATALLASSALLACSSIGEGPDAPAAASSTGANESTATAGGTGGPGGSGSGGAPACAPGETLDCYSGPHATRAVGACHAGVATCDDGGAWGPCEGEVLPAAENCTTPADESCDGTPGPCGETLFAATFGSEAYGASITPGVAEGVTITGRFQGGIDFGTGLLQATQPSDGFVVAFGDSSAATWTRHLSGDFVAPASIAGRSDAVVTGDCGGTADLGQGAVTCAAFVARYDAAGAPLWTLTYGLSSGVSSGTSVAIRPSGAIVVALQADGSSVDVGGGALPGHGGQDIVIVELDPNGEHLWSKRFGGGGDDIARVAIDPQGNIVLAGTFSSGIDFGGGALTSPTAQGVFLTRLGPTGDHQWTLQVDYPFPLTDPSEFFPDPAVTTDAEGGIYFSGGLSSVVNFGLGPMNLGAFSPWVVKVDTAGCTVWVRHFEVAGGNNWAESVRTNAAGDVVVCGPFSAALDLGGVELTPPGDQNVYVAKLSGATGETLWARGFGSSLYDSCGEAAFDASGAVWATGLVWGDTDFGGGVLPVTGRSAFVVKLAD